VRLTWWALKPSVTGDAAGPRGENPTLLAKKLRVRTLFMARGRAPLWGSRWADGRETSVVEANPWGDSALKQIPGAPEERRSQSSVAQPDTAKSVCRSLGSAARNVRPLW